MIPVSFHLSHLSAMLALSLRFLAWHFFSFSCLLKQPSFTLPGALPSAFKCLPTPSSFKKCNLLISMTTVAPCWFICVVCYCLCFMRASEPACKLPVADSSLFKEPVKTGVPVLTAPRWMWVIKIGISASESHQPGPAPCTLPPSSHCRPVDFAHCGRSTCWPERQSPHCRIPHSKNTVLLLHGE